jgi:hypothetical protein
MPVVGNELRHRSAVASGVGARPPGLEFVISSRWLANGTFVPSRPRKARPHRELLEVDELQANFVAFASHELRTRPPASWMSSGRGYSSGSVAATTCKAAASGSPSRVPTRALTAVTSSTSRGRAAHASN